MKILIADDEMLVRASIRSMISEMTLPLDIIDEVSNGEELVNAIRKGQVDIALVDIKMPLLSGLEAIKMLSSEFPDIQWIILTGYSEFSFAQQALRYGVKDYLLKPVSPEDLFDTLEKVIAEKQRYIHLLNMEFSTSINACLNDLIEISFLIDNLTDDKLFSNGKFSSRLIVLESNLEIHTRNKHIQNLIAEINRLIDCHLERNLGFAISFLPSGDFVVCGACNQKSCNNDLGKTNKILEFFKKFDAFIQGYSQSSFYLSILSTNSDITFKEFFREINQLQNLGELIYLYKKSSILSIKDLQNKMENSDAKILKVIHETLQLVNSIQERSKIRYREHLNNLIRLNMQFSEIQKSDTLNIFQRILSDIPELNDNNMDISEYNIQLLNDSESKLFSDTTLQENVTSVNHLVDQAIQFIQNNYSEDIGIAQIAYDLNVTPNYLSSLFRKVTQENFVKYLTKIRLQKAKELLLFPNAQVNQVAEQVGYQTPRYFSKLYKEFYGVYPTDHIQR